MYEAFRQETDFLWNGATNTQMDNNIVSGSTPVVKHVTNRQNYIVVVCCAQAPGGQYSLPILTPAKYRPSWFKMDVRTIELPA